MLWDERQEACVPEFFDGLRSLLTFRAFIETNDERSLYFLNAVEIEAYIELIKSDDKVAKHFLCEPQPSIRENSTYKKLIAKHENIAKMEAHRRPVPLFLREFADVIMFFDHLHVPGVSLRYCRNEISTCSV